MRKITEFINEKLKVTKNTNSDTLTIPPTIHNIHKEYLKQRNRLIGIAEKLERELQRETYR